MRKNHQQISRERIISLTLADVFLQTCLILGLFYIKTEIDRRNLEAKLTDSNGIHKSYKECSQDKDQFEKDLGFCRKSVDELKRSVFGVEPCACKDVCNDRSDIIHIFVFGIQAEGISVIDLDLSDGKWSSLIEASGISKNMVVSLDDFEKTFSSFLIPGQKCKYYVKWKDRDADGSRASYKKSVTVIQKIFQKPY